MANAYGPAELGLLSKAAELLTPWVANLRLDNELQGKAKELAVIDEMGKALGSLDGLERVFGHMAKAVNELIPFDHATVTWIATRLPANSALCIGLVVLVGQCTSTTSIAADYKPVCRLVIKR